MARKQSEDAQDLYDERSLKYDDSHHPRLARHCVELAKARPGEHVLDLACGTGLVSYHASNAVGPSGSVTGVDVSTGMLAQAEEKKPKHHLQNVIFHRHSITELDTLHALNDKQFDLITCCSALVLLPDASAALKQWVSFLKPGGRLVTDVTHPHNLISGIVYERVGIALQRPIPCYRLPFQKADDLREIMNTAGLQSVDVKLISLMDVDGSNDLKDYITDADSPKVEKEYEINDADEVFDKSIDMNWVKGLASPPEVREDARKLFKEEWAKLANVDGKVQAIDGVFVGIGWKQ